MAVIPKELPIEKALLILKDSVKHPSGEKIAETNVYVTQSFVDIKNRKQYFHDGECSTCFKKYFTGNRYQCTTCNTDLCALCWEKNPHLEHVVLLLQTLPSSLQEFLKSTENVPNVNTSKIYQTKRLYESFAEGTTLDPYSFFDGAKEQIPFHEEVKKIALGPNPYSYENDKNFIHDFDESEEEKTDDDSEIHPGQFEHIQPFHVESASTVSNDINEHTITQPIGDANEGEILFAEQNEGKYPYSHLNEKGEVDAYAYGYGGQTTSLQEKTVKVQEIGRNWNEEFQDILKMRQDTLEQKIDRALAIQNLSVEFNKVAEKIGKIIISEGNHPFQYVISILFCKL